MPFLTVVLWVVTVALDAAGQLAFKAATLGPSHADGVARWMSMARRPWIWIGVALYGAEFILWLAFLSVNALSSSVLLASLNIVVVLIGARIFFGERIDASRIVGVTFVVIGVALVGAS